MSTEQPRPPVVARASAAHRLIARSAASLSFAAGVLRIEGRHNPIDIPFTDIDDVREHPSWFWTRLTIRTTNGAQYVARGLPKRDAALLASALREEATQRAQQIGPQLIAQQAELDRALSGERYLRYGDGEQLRLRSALALESASAAIIRKQLRGDARTAYERLGTLANPDYFERARADANRTFIAATLPAVNDILTTSFAITPTDEQAAAIATDEDATLVLAGAGTGKTSVIIGKIAHLVHNQGALPEEILVLAFNRKAAEEIRERLSHDLRGVVVRTFHAFGRDIISDVSGAPNISRLAEDRLARSKAFDQIIDDLVSSPADADAFAQFTSYHSQPYQSPFDFDSFSDYRSYVGSIELRTLSGDQVKSYEELEIANFLSLNGVKFQYEAPYRVNTADPRHRQYQPDFYLPDNDIYIEHFALDADGQAPASWPNYREGVLWKRNLHEKYGTTLIETYSWQQRNNTLLPTLERSLRAHGVQFERTPVAALLGNLRRIIASWLGQLLAAFLSLVKTAGLTMAQLRSRAEQLPNAVRSAAFLDLFERVWQRYEQLLRAENALDFDDLINNATEAVHLRQWTSPFRHILVDEFQDISAGRLALLKALNGPGVAYFLVGDDWQSINRFAGSDVALMTNCGDHLGFVQRRELAHTFRYGEPIIAPSSAFIQRNPEQTRRTLRGPQRSDDDGLVIVAAADQIAGAAQALADIAARVPPQQEASVLILGRYRRSLRNLRLRPPRSDIRLDTSTVHSAKGREADYVIVLDLVDGRSGFPAQREDDPLLGMALSQSSPFPYAEERRLFYVALTPRPPPRYLIADSTRPSPFVQELRRDHQPSPNSARSQPTTPRPAALRRTPRPLPNRQNPSLHQLSALRLPSPPLRPLLARLPDCGRRPGPMLQRRLRRPRQSLPPLQARNPAPDRRPLQPLLGLYRVLRRAALHLPPLRRTATGSPRALTPSARRPPRYPRFGSSTTIGISRSALPARSAYSLYGANSAAICANRSSRSSPSAVRALASSCSAPTMICTSGFAARFRYQAGCLGAPPFEATITYAPSASP